MIDTANLKRWSAFKMLSTIQHAALFRKAELRRYRRGEVLFRQGEVADAVWVVLTGWIHLVRTPAPGDAVHAVTLFTITPREVLCGVSAIEQQPYAADGIAGTDVTAVRVPGGDFDRTLRDAPEFAYRVLQLYAQRIRHMTEQYGSIAEPVSRRIVRSILRLRHQFGDQIPVTHRELAQMSWTTTESAIRIVRQLKARGIVAGHRGELRVVQPAELQELAHHSNGHVTRRVARRRGRTW